MKIKYAVIPAAGFGTRMLPATKAVPKEMLPIVNKPTIQYVVEECIKSGIKEIVIVKNPQKKAIVEHFSNNFGLEKYLKKVNKTKLAQNINKLSKLAKFHFINQTGPYGNATPVLNAKKIIGNNPFAMLFGDDFIYAKPTRLSQMLKVYNKFQAPVVNAVTLKKKEDAKKYGMAKAKKIEDNIYKVDYFVEKPGYENRPSNLVIPGGSILTPEIFNTLENLKTGKAKELWLIDAIDKLIQKGDVYACLINNATYYDTGNKLNFIKTNIDLGLKDPEISDQLKEHIKSKFK